MAPLAFFGPPKWQGLLWCPVCRAWTLFTPTSPLQLDDDRILRRPYCVTCNRCKYRLEVGKDEQERLGKRAQLVLRQYLSRGGRLRSNNKLAADEDIIRQLPEQWTRPPMTVVESKTQSKEERACRPRTVEEAERRLKAEKEANTDAEHEEKA